MFYIYHIPGVKIGCSKNPKIRVKVQGYTEYTILEEYEDIDIASIREQELQKEYGYRVDTIKYKHSSEIIERYRSKENSSKGGKKLFELGIGAFSLTKEQRSKLSQECGNKAKDLGIGIFSLTKEERSDNGKKGGLKNKLSGHISELGKKYGSIQGKKNVENKFWENITSEQRALGAKRAHELHKEMYSEMAKINIRKKSICPYCQKEGQRAVMGRWHFENCKQKPQD
jgi:hypothetical protein